MALSYKEKHAQEVKFVVPVTVVEVEGQEGHLLKCVIIIAQTMSTRVDVEVITTMMVN